MLTLPILVATLLGSQPDVADAPPSRTLRTGASAALVVEVLPRRTTREIRTPEGFIREEEPAPDDGSVGSFGVYHVSAPAEVAASTSFAELPAAAAPTPDEAPPEGRPRDLAAPEPPGPPPAAAGCRPERQRYLRRLWRSAGIDVERPLDLLDGLSGGGAPPEGVVSGAWTAGVEPIRPLAWDQELRSLGRDLADCERRGGAPPPGAPR